MYLGKQPDREDPLGTFNESLSGALTQSNYPLHFAKKLVSSRGPLGRIRRSLTQRNFRNKLFEENGLVNGNYWAPSRDPHRQDPSRSSRGTLAQSEFLDKKMVSSTGPLRHIREAITKGPSNNETSLKIAVKELVSSNDSHTSSLPS